MTIDESQGRQDDARLAGHFRGEQAGLLITGGLAVIVALSILSAPSRDERLLMAGYQNFWSGRGPSSADFREALRRDPASPYRWCDLSEALLDENEITGAQYCISQAVALGPNVPAILLRAVNMNWLIGKPDLSLTYSQRILALTAQYDSVLFHTYDRMGLTVEQVLIDGLPATSRPAQSYFRYLLVGNHIGELEVAWRWMSDRAFVDEGLVRDYAAYLFSQQLYSNAADIWAAYARTIPNGYSDSNLIFNGDFERPISGAVLDWQIAPADHIEVRQTSDRVYSGSKSLHIRFNGSAPAAYQNISQSIVLTRAGEYQFEAQVRSQDLACQEGIRFAIFDGEVPTRLAIVTDQATGTTDWTRIQHAVPISPQTRVLKIQVILRPSLCAGTRVFGDVWIDAVKLIPQR